MNDPGEASKTSSSNDRLGPEWEEFCSRLEESGHRFNARYAQRKSVGEDLDPHEAVQYFIQQYERTAALAVKQVKDHESALGCVEGLDDFLKRMLKLSSRLLRPRLRRESFTTSQAELRRCLLLRSERWKADGFKRARSVALADRLKVRNEQTAATGGRAKGDWKSHRPEVKPLTFQILTAAMDRHGLNGPKLAAKMRGILKRRGETKSKADRSTVYRILKRETKKPQPAVRNALIEALQLEGEDASTVRRELSGTEAAPTSTQAQSRKL
jgi:hypothetical protein